MDPGIPLRIRAMEEEVAGGIDSQENLYGSLARRIMNLRALQHRMTGDLLGDYRDLIGEEGRIIDSLTMAGKITEAQREKLHDLIMEPSGVPVRYA